MAANIAYSYSQVPSSVENRTTRSENILLRLNLERVWNIYAGLKALTEPFIDKEGRALQLWRAPGYGLLGTVSGEKSGLKIIAGHKIFNPLQYGQSPGDLLEALETAQITRWQLSYDVNQFALTIWPCLEAAAKGDKVPDYASSYARAEKEASHKKVLPNGTVRFYMKEKPSSAPGYDKPMRMRGSYYVKEYNPNTKNYRSWYETCDAQGTPKMVHPKSVNGKSVNAPHYPPTGKDRAEMTDAQKASAEKAQERLINKREKQFDNHTTPPERWIRRVLQQTRLTSDYNATHPKNPVPPKGATGGTIGGVACSTTYIEGLFDTPESLFESEHIFCVPGLPDGKLPFSNAELKQIIREVAIGVYVHSTVPFFSLHFNENCDQFPVIHPAYQNTLVGRVISMLDYIMKGYLNGGVFKEGFIDGWQQNPNWDAKKNEAVKQLIDFQEYCEKEGLEEYLSLRDLQQHFFKKEGIKEKLENKIDAALGGEQESAELKNLKGFHNSFRIIAKQNSIRKEGNLFYIDCDFDVKYTIEPSPAYQSAVDDHMRKYGTTPKSLQGLEQAYGIFCERIHDHMVQLPLCRDYFAMLGVINFLSGYFSTLKKFRKVPTLPAAPIANPQGSPYLFPYLPIRKTSKVPLEQNAHLLLTDFFKKYQVRTDAFFNKIRQNVNLGLPPTPIQEKMDLFVPLMEEMQAQMITRAGNIRGIAEKIKENKRVQEELDLMVSSLVDKMEEIAVMIINHQQDLPNQMTNGLSDLAEGNRVVQDLFQHLVNQDRNLLLNFFNNLYNHLTQATPIDLNVKNTLKNRILQRAQQRNFILPGNLAADAVEVFEKTFTAALNNGAKIFKKGVKKVFNDEWGSIAKLSVTHIQLKPEIGPVEVETGERVVGGCGMHLEVQAVRTCSIAKEIIRKNAFVLSKLKCEEWTAVTFGHDNRKGFVFSLPFANVPSGIADDYGWLEYRLLPPEVPDANLTEQLILILDAMQAADLQKFEQLIAQKPLDRMVDRFGRTLMHHAAACNEMAHDYVKLLKKRGLKTQVPDIYGYYPIHYAASSGSLAALKELIKDSNCRSKNGETPLVVAIESRRLEHVQALLEANPSIETTADGYTPLHCALHEGFLPVVYAVLNKVGPRVINHNCKEGGTPLMLACELDDENLVEKMLTLNADPTLLRRDGITAVEIAIRRGSVPLLIKLLSRTKVDPLALETAAKQGSVEILSLLVKQSVFYQHRSASKETLLQIALRFGNLKGAELIAQQAPNSDYFNVPNKEGETAYLLAAAFGAWEVIKILTKRGGTAEVKGSLSHLMRTDYQPVLGSILDSVPLKKEELEELALKAAQAGNTQALYFEFKKRGVDFTKLQGSKGWRILHYLAKADGVQLFKELLGKSHDLLHRLKDEGGKTLAYIAAERGSLKVLRMLLTQMVANKTSLLGHYNDRHLLYGILERGDLEQLRLFFTIYEEQKKNLLNAALDGNGTRAAHLAAKMDEPSIIRFLIAAGANLALSDNRGYNALCYALLAKGHKVVSLLLKEHSQEVISPQALCIAATMGNRGALLTMHQMTISQKDLNHALYLAILEQDPEAVERLHQMGAQHAHVTETGENVLTAACATGQDVILKEVLKDPAIKKAFPNPVGAFMQAAKRGYLHCILALLDGGYHAPSDLQFSAVNSLGAILAKDKERYRKQVVDMGKFLTDPANLQDPPTLVKVLKTWDPNAAIAVEVLGRSLWGTPLQILLHFFGKGFPVKECAALLGNPQLNPNLPDSLGCSTIHLLARNNLSPIGLQGVDWKLTENEGRTALHLAATHAEPHVFKAILKELARLNLMQLIHAKDKTGRTPLFYAVMAGSKEGVELLLKNGAETNIYDTHLITPLCCAICGPSPSLFILQTLLAAGADPNMQVTTERSTPLFLALECKSDELTRCLLFSGANYHTNVGAGRTLMHIAAETGKTSLINLFAAKGISFEGRDENGLQPIHLAAAHEDLEAVKTLVALHPESLHAPVAISGDCNEELKDLLGATPLHMAAQGNNPMLVEFLLKQHARTEAETKEGLVPLSFAAANATKGVIDLFYPYNISKSPKVLSAALVRAISEDNVDTVEQLYKRGVPIDSFLMDGVTGLHFACIRGAIQTTEWLLQQGADATISSPLGSDSFQHAAANNSVAQFALLFEFFEPDPNELRQNSETLLHTAAKAGNIGHAIYLLQHFAHLDAPDSKEDTPLHAALKAGHHAMVEFLLAAGADVTLKGAFEGTLLQLAADKDEQMQAVVKRYIEFATEGKKRGDSPLHRAIRSGNPLAIQLLIKMDDIEIENTNKETPLHVAARLNSQTACRYLLAAEASYDAKDSEGKTALERALVAGLESSQILLDFGAKATASMIDTVKKSALPWRDKLLPMLERNKLP